MPRGCTRAPQVVEVVTGGSRSSSSTLVVVIVLVAFVVVIVAVVVVTLEVLARLSLSLVVAPAMVFVGSTTT